MTHATCRLTAKNRDQLRNPTLGNRVWATIAFFSVATYSRCDGIFINDFVANLPLSLPVKEFRKSVNIWGSYGQEFSVVFFDSRCIESAVIVRREGDGQMEMRRQRR